MLLFRVISSRPVMGGGSDFMSSASERRSARSRFIVEIAPRRAPSVISTVKRDSSSALSFRSSLTQCPKASSSSGFWVSSSMYVGRDRARSSYIFFFPSQVVSATTRSAISRKGFVFSRW